MPGPVDEAAGAREPARSRQRRQRRLGNVARRHRVQPAAQRHRSEAGAVGMGRRPGVHLALEGVAKRLPAPGIDRDRPRKYRPRPSPQRRLLRMVQVVRQREPGEIEPERRRLHQPAECVLSGAHPKLCQPLRPRPAARRRKRIDDAPARYRAHCGLVAQHHAVACKRTDLAVQQQLRPAGRTRRDGRPVQHREPPGDIGRTQMDMHGRSVAERARLTAKHTQPYVDAPRRPVGFRRQAPSRRAKRRGGAARPRRG